MTLLPPLAPSLSLPLLTNLPAAVSLCLEHPARGRQVNVTERASERSLRQESRQVWQEAYSGGPQWTAQNQHHPPWGFLYTPSQALGPEGLSPKGSSSPTPLPFCSYRCIPPSTWQGLPRPAPDGSPILTRPPPLGPRTHPHTASRSHQFVFLKSCHGSLFGRGCRLHLTLRGPSPASCFLEPTLHSGTSLLMASQMPSHTGGHLGEEQ